MRTTVQKRTPAPSVQPVTASARPRTENRESNERQPEVESHLDSASRLGHRFGTVDVQPTLTLGPVDDKYEQEADRAAMHVVASAETPGHLPAGPSPHITPVAGNTAIQRVADGTGSGGSAEVGPATGDVAAGIHTSLGNGQSLPGTVQGAMENAFGARFHEVRIHTDARSHSLNRRLGARAFTVGNDVFFKGGHYTPGTHRGQRLLAHELTHVLQQRRGALRIQRNGDSEEDEERSSGWLGGLGSTIARWAGFGEGAETTADLADLAGVSDAGTEALGNVGGAINVVSEARQGNRTSALAKGAGMLGSFLEIPGASVLKEGAEAGQGLVNAFSAARSRDTLQQLSQQAPRGSAMRRIAAAHGRQAQEEVTGALGGTVSSLPKIVANLAVPGLGTALGMGHQLLFGQSESKGAERRRRNQEAIVAKIHYDQLRREGRSPKEIQALAQASTNQRFKREVAKRGRSRRRR